LFALGEARETARPFLGTWRDRRASLIVFFCIRDYQGDVLNAIRTNAVIFGKRCAFAASAALFTLAYAVRLLLALQRVMPRALAVLIVLYPVHARWSLEALRDGLTYAGIRRLQTRYRLLFAMLAAAMLAALFISGSP
jgi:lycopene elongase/hydratase (dihydrobisanhydrobacterioruberin-forming)